jgi:hypothetical protein
VPGGYRDFAQVLAVAVHGGSVWVGGEFTSAGGTAAANLARWDGQAWWPGAQSANGFVEDLAEFMGDLYAGGHFTVIDGTPILRIARWDGASWQPVGGGTNGAVYALAEFDGSLYAGGYFSSAGGSPAYGLARWDGQAWTSMNTYPPREVQALASYAGNLIVGGAFDTFNGVPAENIVAWDGSTWSPLAAGLNGPVYALATHQGAVYAGGYFYASGTQFMSSIARWDDGEWCGLGAGMNPERGEPSVHALASHAGTLFAGGDFSIADDIPSGFVARWASGNPNPVTFLSYGACWCEGRAEVRWESTRGDELAFALYRRGEKEAGFHPLALPVVRTNSYFYVRDKSAVRNDSYVYRVVALSNGRIVASFDVALAGNRPPLALHQNRPNPFAVSSVISFELPDAADVHLAIYDVTGRARATLIDKRLPSGWHSVTLESTDLPAGIYFYRLRAGKHVVARKLTLLK